MKRSPVRIRVTAQSNPEQSDQTFSTYLTQTYCLNYPNPQSLIPNPQSKENWSRINHRYTTFTQDISQVRLDLTNQLYNINLIPDLNTKIQITFANPHSYFDAFNTYYRFHNNQHERLYDLFHSHHSCFNIGIHRTVSLQKKLSKIYV